MEPLSLDELKLNSALARITDFDKENNHVQSAISSPNAHPSAASSFHLPSSSCPSASPPSPAKYRPPHSPNPSNLATFPSSLKPAPSSSPFPMEFATVAPATLSSFATHAYGHTQATSPTPQQQPFARPHPYPSPPSHSHSTPTAQHQPYLRPVGSAQAQAAQHEPTMDQLLASQGKGLSSYSSRMVDRDSTMSPATGVVSWRKGQGFKEWEKVRLNSAEVKRKADVAQLCACSLFPLSFKTL